MTSTKSRFSSLAQAVKERTADNASATGSPDLSRPAGAGIHKPAAALSAVSESLRDHISRLEGELAHSKNANADLRRELEYARSLQDKAGADADEFAFLDPASVDDHLPRDRLRGRTEGRQFEELLADVRQHGQNDPITVRPVPSGRYEIAAGRRRLAVCIRLGSRVLARVRNLDDEAMLRIQFSENERRADISALERARWFADVRDRLQTSGKEIAAQFGVDPSTFSLYLRLARFPDEILERLEEPRRLAMLPARRVMEAIENDAGAVQRIVAALDAYRETTSRDSTFDSATQIDVLLRAAEGKQAARGNPRSPVPDRRHIVHQGRRIGTLTRNGGQWVFRFATSIPDDEVHALAERLAVPVVDAPRPREGTDVTRPVKRK
ncbi:MAG: ParB/RepB/Spo0J family partition protein [Proteobacteria bacterium]|nr:ParB/RepB/Spo0J family partition protein [Pseudomonadota bacterium]